MNALSKRPAGRRWPFALGAVVLVLVVAVGICEALGWPFLVAPLQHRLARTLDRKVEFGTGPSVPDVRIGLLGSIRVRAGRIEIGAPGWSSAPYTFLAQDVTLKMTYGDAWRVYRGGLLRIESLQAATFDSQFERLSDGRASWQFGSKPQPDEPEHATHLPEFGTLRVDDGKLAVHDAMTPLELDAKYSLTDANDGARRSQASAPPSTPSSPSSTSSSPASASAASSGAGGAAPPGVAASSPGGLQLSATGQYKKIPLNIAVSTSGVLALAGSAAPAQPVVLDAVIGHARLTFNGTATDPIHLTALRGRFNLAGTSLASVGAPLGVTLPTTPAFAAAGSVAKDGLVWKAVFDRATIGSSLLNGAFTYDKSSTLPLLSGRLGGSRLLLADLGPAVGGAPRPMAGTSKPEPAPSSAKPGRVIPDRHFDLPSLRAMNANVLIDIGDLDLGTDKLEPLKPLQGHLTLLDGVLRVDQIFARTAHGELSGGLALDGRGKSALWTADLNLLGVKLEHWVHVMRKGGAPPYISGRLDGRMKVAGQGRSTAEILGSLDGGIRFHLRDATLSHLAVEAAGIDVAQAIGMLIKGDDSLALQCNVADFGIANGVARPKVFILSTSDSTMWVDGSVSLLTENIDLRASVAPKDFSPFAVRTPIHVRGTFSSPAVSLEKANIAGKVGIAALLGLLNPLAAIIPFIDTGSRDKAAEADRDCAALVQRGSAPLAAPKRSTGPKPH